MIIAKLLEFNNRGYQKMKKSLILSILIFLFNCNGNSIVGSDDVTEISYVEFSEIETYNSGGYLELSGRAKNISSNKTISSPWYIECQFYADGDKILKLGGDNVRITYPLEPAQEALWTIRWFPTNESNINLDDYPDFTYDDLRAYKD